MIDEINMNVNEDYKHFLRKKLQSKEYSKDYSKLVQTSFGMATSENEDRINGLLPKEYHLN